MKRLFVTLCAVLFCIPLLAQDKTEVAVSQVNDRRTNGSFSHLTIGLDLPKVRSADVSASRVLVTAATDDTGRNLIDAESGEPQLEPNRYGQMQEGQAAQPVAVSMTLKNPDRKATKVSEVRGSIELYMPGNDPNSVAEIPKFLSSSGKPVTHKALKANGVEISFVSPAQLDAERKRLSDIKRKEAADAGLTGEDLDNYVKSYAESLLPLDEGEVLLRVKDPKKSIQEISYVDAAGEVKRASARDEDGFTNLSTWGEKPQADWKLRVSMKTPKNMVRKSFALANVPLP